MLSFLYDFEKKNTCNLISWSDAFRCNDAQRKFHSAPAKRRYASREFHSTKIVKRHGCSTLETSDGFIVSLCGFINKSRSLENGYSTEVCATLGYIARKVATSDWFNIQLFILCMQRLQLMLLCSLHLVFLSLGCLVMTKTTSQFRI